MAIILSIETATTVCSVALTDKDRVVAKKKLMTDRSHANQLTLLIEEMMDESGASLKHLDAVAVSSGPGSYTGLRIGGATAKGICFAMNLPLISVSTLEAMAFEANQNNDQEALLCPMIDARRMEVYTALYDNDLNSLASEKALVLDFKSFEETLSKSKMLFFGDGSPKFQELLKSKNGSFLDEFTPSAWAVGLLAYQKSLKNEFEDLAYFEPNYLKEFKATTPKALL